MEILRILIYIVAIGGSLVCFVNHKKLPIGFFWLGMYLAYVGISQIIGYSLGKVPVSNLEFYNINTIVYTVLIYLIYYKLTNIKRTRLWLNIVFTIAFVLVCIAVLQGLFIYDFSVEALLISSIAAVMGALISLYAKIKNPMHISPLKMGWLWLLMGFLFYYSSTFSYWVAFKFTEFLIDRTTLIFFNVVLILIFYLILLTAIIVQLKFGDANNKPKPRKIIRTASLIQ